MSPRAEHQRHREVREAGERRDHEEEDHQRRVDGEEAVEGLRVEELHARLRELGAHQHREQAADQEEDDRRDEVLHADHLVIGVDAEVVLPAVRAVRRVILRARRLAEGVVDPVVERAEPGEEAERRRDEQRDEDDRLPVEQRVPAAPPAQDDDEPEAEGGEERSHPGGADPARARAGSAAPSRAAAVRARGPRGRRSLRSRALSHPFLLDWTRYWTSASSCAFGRSNGGITFFG